MEINKDALRDYPELMSKKCEDYLKSDWGEKLEEGLKDLLKFIKETVNPSIRNTREKKNYTSKQLPHIIQARYKNNKCLNVVVCISQ
ncbi:MAG: hypothetical protein PHY73_02100 [Candidatus Omnitrophica bacterium]|nr:hypothetical protein [Candidatus Omnitrophota bacterium]